MQYFARTGKTYPADTLQTEQSVERNQADLVLLTYFSQFSPLP